MTVPHKLAPALIVGAVLASSALAGCTKDGDQATPTPTPTSAAPTVPAPPPPKEPSFSGKPVGAVFDVKVVDCPTDAGNQIAKLEVTNSAKSARDYSIMVIWLKNGSGTPLGWAQTKANDAKPGTKVALTAKGKVVEKADKCVLNVKAGTLK